MKMHTLFLVLLLFILATAMFFLLPRRAESINDEQFKESRRENNENSISVPDRDTVMINWEGGPFRSYEYYLQIATTSSLDDSVPILTVKGVYNMRLLNADADSIRCITNFSKTSVIGPNGPRPESARLAEEIPVIVEFTYEGLIRNYISPRYLVESDVAFLEGLRTVQVAVNGWNPESPMVLAEKGSAGMLQSRYSYLGGDRFSKKSIKILDTDNADQIVDFRTTITRSDFTFTLGEFWISEFGGSEDFATDVFGETVKSSFTIFLSELKSSDIAETALGGFTHSEEVSSFHRNSPVFINSYGSDGVVFTEERQQALEFLSRIPFSEAYGKLNSNIGKAESQSDRAEAMHEFANWLEANPGSASQLLDTLGETGDYSPVAAAAIHSLELSGASLASQRVIASLLSGDDDLNFSDDLRLLAVLAVGGLGEILDETLMGGMSALAFENVNRSDIENSALLALGILAENNLDLRTGLTERLMPVLQREKESGITVVLAVKTLANGRIVSGGIHEQLESMYALGNTDSGVKKAILEYFEDLSESDYVDAALNGQDPALRQCAVELVSTREILEPDVRRTLFEIAANKSESDSLRTTTINGLLNLGDGLSDSEALMLFNDESLPVDVRERIASQMDDSYK